MYIAPVMILFDLTYANERIACITQTYDKMIALYMQIKDKAPSKDDLRNLTELYGSVRLDISNYYKYLEETEISPEESYLTSWIDKGSFYDDMDEIEYFVRNE